MHSKLHKSLAFSANFLEHLCEWLLIFSFAIINFKITDSLASSGSSFCITQPGFFCSKGNELRCLVRQEVTVVPCYRACDLENYDHLVFSYSFTLARKD